MVDNTVKVSRDGFARLQSAAAEFARGEIKRLAQVVIEELRSLPANDSFGDVAARHLWDEYCWALQEGPFDDDLYLDDMNIGSFSGAFDGVASGCAENHVQKLPKYAQVFLSAEAFEEDSSCDVDTLGGIWIEGIVNLILNEVKSSASERNLDLIGPDRGDTIGYEVEASGLVWSALSDRDEAMEIIRSHAETIITPGRSLSTIANELVEAYIIAAKEEAEDTILVDFIERFEPQISELIKKADVLPCLEDMRAGLLEKLDP